MKQFKYDTSNYSAYYLSQYKTKSSGRATVLEKIGGVILFVVIVGVFALL